MTSMELLARRRSRSVSTEPPEPVPDRPRWPTRSPLALDPATVVLLQRSVGNRAVNALLSAGRAQPGSRLVQRMGAMKAKELVGAWGPEYQRRYSLWWAERDYSHDALEPLDEVGLKEALDTFGPVPEESFAAREFTTMYRDSAVLKTLVAGTEVGSPEARLAKLLDNFKGVTFDYTMDSVAFDGFLKGRGVGDCSTLVRTFDKIATLVLGIPVVIKSSKDRGFDPSSRFIAPQGETIGVKKRGNVDDGAFWHFDNHFWIEHEGKQYDVLFGRMGVDSSKWVKRTGASAIPSAYERPSFALGALAPKEGPLKLWATGIGEVAKRYTTVEPKAK